MGISAERVCRSENGDGERLVVPVPARINSDHRDHRVLYPQVAPINQIRRRRDGANSPPRHNDTKNLFHHRGSRGKRRAGDGRIHHPDYNYLSRGHREHKDTKYSPARQAGNQTVVPTGFTDGPGRHDHTAEIHREESEVREEVVSVLAVNSVLTVPS